MTIRRRKIRPLEDFKISRVDVEDLAMLVLLTIYCGVVPEEGRSHFSLRKKPHLLVSLKATISE
jgi:hypothetical protein